MRDQFTTFATVSISHQPCKTRRQLACVALGFEQLSLAEMLEYFRVARDRAATDQRRAFCERQIAKIQDCIGVTLGLKRARAR